MPHTWLSPPTLSSAQTYPSLSDQSIPISSASSRSLAPMGMMPLTVFNNFDIGVHCFDNIWKRKAPIHVKIVELYLAADPHRDVIEQGLGELLLDGRHVLLRQVGPQQPHPAVDVETHAARRHHGLGVLRV